MSQRLRSTLVLATLLLAASSCSSTPRSSHEPVVDSATDGKLRSAISGPARTEKERARDVYRHPVETLEFFGLKDDMNVIELSPGGGWYTAVIAPVLRDKGTFHVTSGDPDGPPGSESTVFAKELAGRFAKEPATFDKIQIIRVKEGGDLSLGPDGSADMVLVFRSVHNWVAANMLDAVTASIVRVLKSGGVLGIEAHRAQKGAPTDAQAADKSGYLPEEFVIQRMEAAGLGLAGRSEINANPKDDRNHPDGVWTLPPTFAQKDVDRAKYAAIGESDRMTLRFVKR